MIKKTEHLPFTISFAIGSFIGKAGIYNEVIEDMDEWEHEFPNVKDVLKGLDKVQEDLKLEKDIKLKAVMN